MDVFKFTEDQQTALKLIGGTVRNLLLFGGSRSGKTLILLFSIVLRQRNDICHNTTQSLQLIFMQILHFSFSASSLNKPLL